MKDEEKYLEDEMEKFGERWPYPSSFDGYDKNWVDELTEECAKHFYELGKKDMKEQMMKEAVEYDVWDFSVEACPRVNIPLDNKQYRNGDKVRVIVLKKED